MADEPVTEEAQGTPRNLTVDERNRPILDVVGDQAVGRTSPAELGGGQFQYTPQDIQQQELLQTEGKTVEPSVSLTSQQVQQSDTPVTPQVSVPLSQGKARTISSEELPITSNAVPTAVKIEGQLSNQSQVDAAVVQDSRTREEMLSRGTLATAQTQDLSQEATVEFQLEQIYASLEEGKPLPAWAAPNVKKVQDIMNARGLGASSVAAAAMVQAIA